VDFRPDTHLSSIIYPDDEKFPSRYIFLYPEALNCSRLHPSGRLSNMSGHLSVFDKLRDFFPKHRYGKIAETVRMMWCSRSDAILDMVSHVEEVQPSGCQTPWSRCSSLNMEIACSRSATIRTLGQHCLNATLFRKEINQIRKADCTVVHPDAFNYCPDTT
jgi:hypothetical protein